MRPRQPPQVPQEAREVGGRLQLFRVDAFTTQAYTGNPAAIVPDADGLDDATMQAIAREQGFDTAFILPADGPDHDLRLRFFTPRTEAGFVGHATLAAHAVLEALGRPPARRQRQRSGIVQVERIDGPTGRCYAFIQPPPPLQPALARGQLSLLLEALGLHADEIDAGLPPVIAGSGSTRALVAVRAGATLARLRPDLPRLAALSAAGGPPGYFVYTLAPAVPDCDTEARMFCPAIGIDEDPVSGNAHAMLAAYLCALGKWPANVNARKRGRDRAREFTGRQGHHMRRPGTLEVRVEPGAGAPQRVRVAGSATIVMEAQLATRG